MVGFEKVLRVKVIKDQIQYRSQSLLNLAHDYFSVKFENSVPGVCPLFLHGNKVFMYFYSFHDHKFEITVIC